VNPVFWKLTGWIDERVNHWAQANGVVAIAWQGRWEGPPGVHAGSGAFSGAQAGHTDLGRMRQVAAILADAGHTGFFEILTDFASPAR
ncbi:MAG: hypothetical protein ABI806_25130, partial [Candidatus Solibacter sp.]